MATSGSGGPQFPISFTPPNVAVNTNFTASFSNTSNYSVQFTLGSNNVTGLPAGTQYLGASSSLNVNNCQATSSLASITVNVTSPSDIGSQQFSVPVSSVGPD